MIFLNKAIESERLHDLLPKSVIVIDEDRAQYINDRSEGNAIAIDFVEGDNEILYFKKGKQLAKMVSLFTGLKVKPSRDKFLMSVLCPAIIIKAKDLNINDVAEALLEL